MEKLTSKSLFDSLQQIPDPRVERTKRHLLVDILVIAICASICGAESWEAHCRVWTSQTRVVQPISGVAGRDCFARYFPTSVSVVEGGRI